LLSSRSCKKKTVLIDEDKIGQLCLDIDAGMSLHQAAEKYRCSTSTVRNRYFAARGHDIDVGKRVQGKRGCQVGTSFMVFVPDEIATAARQYQAGMSVDGFVSPCRQCPLHTAKIAKDNDVCRDCALRLVYVGQIGAMTHSMPDRLMDAVAKRRIPMEGQEVTGTGDDAQVPQVMEPAVTVETKLCLKCRRELPIDMFLFASKGVRKLRCKDCTNAERRRRYAQIKENIVANMTARQTGDGTGAAALNVKRDEPCRVVCIDFALYPELWDAMHAWCKKEFRTMDQQILFFLHEVRRRNPEMEKCAGIKSA